MTDRRDQLALIAEAVARAWAAATFRPEPGCELCDDTGYLDAPVGVWRPLCPRFACATKRRHTTPPYG